MPNGTISYTIKSGDTLFSLARTYGTTVAEILRLNPLITDPDYLRVGQIITIPVGSQPTGSYVVRSGDTLYGISRRFNTTVEYLARVNNIAPPYTIYPGQRLIVPA